MGRVSQWKTEFEILTPHHKRRPGPPHNPQTHPLPEASLSETKGQRQITSQILILIPQDYNPVSSFRSCCEYSLPVNGFSGHSYIPISLSFYLHLKIKSPWAETLFCQDTGTVIKKPLWVVRDFELLYLYMPLVFHDQTEWDLDELYQDPESQPLKERDHNTSRYSSFHALIWKQSSLWHI